MGRGTGGVLIWAEIVCGCCFRRKKRENNSSLNHNMFNTYVTTANETKTQRIDVGRGKSFVCFRPLTSQGMSTLAEQSADTSTLESLLSTIDVSPETFLQASPTVHAASLVAAKKLLDPVIAHYSVFNELALRGLDTEQVWEQIRLVGEQVKSVVESQSGINGDDTSIPENETDEVGSDSEDESLLGEDEVEGDDLEEDDQLSLDEDQEMEDDEEIEDTEDEEEGEEDDEDEFPVNPEDDAESGSEDTKLTTAKPFKKDVHGLNDEFFSIDDFNRLSEQQDAQRSEDENADEIDYFAGTSLQK